MHFKEKRLCLKLPHWSPLGLSAAAPRPPSVSPSHRFRLSYSEGKFHFTNNQQDKNILRHAGLSQAIHIFFSRDSSISPKREISFPIECDFVLFRRTCLYTRAVENSPPRIAGLWLSKEFPTAPFYHPSTAVPHQNANRPRHRFNAPPPCRRQPPPAPDGHPPPACRHRHIPSAAYSPSPPSDNYARKGRS